MRLRLAPLALAAALVATLAAAASAQTTATLHTRVVLSPMVLQTVQARGSHETLPAGFADNVTTLYVEGSRARIDLPMNFGDFLVNLDTRKLTALNPSKRQYETVNLKPAAATPERRPAPRAGRAGAAPERPSQLEQALSQLHLTTSTANTGKTAVIVGVPSAETEARATAGLANQPNALTITLDVWTPSQANPPQLADVDHFLAAYRAIPGPTHVLEPLAHAVPGLGPQLVAMLRNLETTLGDRPILRAHIEVVSPMAAHLLAAEAAAHGVNVPVSDPNAPLLQATAEFTSLSRVPLPAATFAIPAGYSPAPRHSGREDRSGSSHK